MGVWTPSQEAGKGRENFMERTDDRRLGWQSSECPRRLLWNSARRSKSLFDLATVAPEVTRGRSCPLGRRRRQTPKPRGAHETGGDDDPAMTVRRKFVCFKVHRGTADQGQRSLCETCRWATVIRGATLPDEIVECNQLSIRDQRVPFPVDVVLGLRRSAQAQDPRDGGDRLGPAVGSASQPGRVRSSSRLTDEERFVLGEN
jgi:hypothetical protein